MTNLNYKTCLPIAGAGLVGSMIAIFSELVQKGEASSVMYVIGVFENLLHFDNSGVMILSFLIFLGPALALIFNAKTPLDGFLKGVASLSVAFTGIPFETVPTISSSTVVPSHYETVYREDSGAGRFVSMVSYQQPEVLANPIPYTIQLPKVKLIPVTDDTTVVKVKSTIKINLVGTHDELEWAKGQMGYLLVSNREGNIVGKRMIDSPSFSMNLPPGELGIRFILDGYSVRTIHVKVDMIGYDVIKVELEHNFVPSNIQRIFQGKMKRAK
jgi:hypothetical protein